MRLVLSWPGNIIPWGLNEKAYRQPALPISIKIVPPSPRILERAERMREKGMFRHLAVSGHNRSLFPDLAAEPRYDPFHVRYNAAHTGAETEIFPKLPVDDRPGMVTYTATRWGDLVNAGKMPSGEAHVAMANKVISSPINLSRPYDNLPV